MSLKIRALGALAGLLAFFATAGMATAADRAYTEGPVSVVSSIRTEPGMFDEYMKWLQSGWKASMEAQKTAGIILDYHVYVANPRSPQDPDLYLVAVYKDMAAFDNMDAKLDPIMEKMFGSQQKMSEGAIARGKMRTVLGDQMLRRLDLK